ncbi:potassium channel family protein [Plantactinospora mayteni]|uniref:potassium channel family protein n=1 Tax=Plantactinospora mayteni TaxID=566021 RepID=UPI001EF5298B|nr:TrkA family potassium uptake protein [Plantactinospora mayteni]
MPVPAAGGKAPTAGEGVTVIGLGRFGGQVASTLRALGHDVLGIDVEPQRVQQWSDVLRHVVQTDSTDEVALRQLGVPDLGRAVVGIGENIEASVLTVLALAELGVKEIWARASSAKHGKILSAMGAHHVIYPEAAMGDRVAHLITTRMLDFITLDDTFSLAMTRAPQNLVGRTVGQSSLREKFGVLVVGVKAADDTFAFALPETVVPADSMIVVAGSAQQVQEFAAST